MRGRDIPLLSEDCNAATIKVARGAFALDDRLIAIYVAFEILDAVVSDVQSIAEIQNGGGHARLPNIEDEELWKKHTDRILNVLARDTGADFPAEQKRMLDDAIWELRRTEGGELHNISALTGGLVAQEALKVLTRQYVPLDNTCVFDGARSQTAMYRL
jgi:amyloid beta precursor protein binding protein 1